MKAGHHAAKGHAKKHTHAHKHVHHHHAKHHPHHQKKAHHVHHKAKVHTVGHHQKHAKGLAQVPGDVACCVSEALAASLRHLQPPGLSITGADILALHRAAGADDDHGAPILAVLEAAAEIGLAGVGLASYYAVEPDAALPPLAGRLHCGPDAVVDEAWAVATSRLPAGSILGLDLPGPHAVTVVPGGWLSWGELFCPWCEWPDATIDEAWAVSWL